MDVSRMIDVLALESDLEAAAAHPEMHGVHVNLAWIGLVSGWQDHVSIFVLEQRNEDLDFLTSPLPN